MAAPSRAKIAAMAEADRCVADDDRPIRVCLGEPCGEHRLGREPGCQRPDRRGDVADEVVPGEDGRPALIRRRLAERGLLDGEERPDLVAGRADDPDGGREDQERNPARGNERDPGDHHQERPGEEDPPAPEPVGAGRQPERDDRVADERQGQDDPDREWVEAERDQVEDEDDRQRAVGEHSEDPAGEQEAPVAVEASEARDQARLDGGGPVSGGLTHEVGGGWRIGVESTWENAAGGDARR